MSWLRPPASHRQRVREKKKSTRSTTHVCTPKANCKAAALTAAITKEAGSCIKVQGKLRDLGAKRWVVARRAATLDRQPPASAPTSYRTGLETTQPQPVAHRDELEDDCDIRVSCTVARPESRYPYPRLA